MDATLDVIGTARGQRAIRDVFLFLDGRVMNKPEVMVPGANDKIRDGRLSDETSIEFVAKMMEAFDDWIAYHRTGT